LVELFKFDLVYHEDPANLRCPQFVEPVTFCSGVCHGRYLGPAPCTLHPTIAGVSNSSACAAAGDLNIELHSDLAPRAAENFLVLADKGYYTGTKFHRSIKNFMIQVGLSLLHQRGCTESSDHLLAGFMAVRRCIVMVQL
jgi:Cyclophilin type peptidyl-prolyl cis-trans isomerase/CLD